MNSKHRILVMSHAHPDFSLGGGEIAAYNLYKAYRDNESVEQAWFLARADRRRGLTGAVRQLTMWFPVERNYLTCGSIC